MAIDRTAEQQAIFDRIRPLSTARWVADYPWSRAVRAIEELGHDFGTLELTPDFQRGHVWTEAQQSRFIESCLRGVVNRESLVVQMNCPNFELDDQLGDIPDLVQCIDGLQRLTAIDRFVKGEITAFGYTADDLEGTEFCVKRQHIKVAVHTFRWRRDLLDHYLTINAGGTPHSAEEIERVRGLLADAQTATA